MRTLLPAKPGQPFNAAPHCACAYSVRVCTCVARTDMRLRPRARVGTCAYLCVHMYLCARVPTLVVFVHTREYPCACLYTHDCVRVFSGACVPLRVHMRMPV